VARNDFQSSKDFAAAMTADDPLAKYRERFYFPQSPDGNDCVYLCGHSLGLQPKSVRAFVEQELDDWKRFAVDAHFQARNPWLPYHEILTDSTARLVGALPMEVVVMNSLTVNLHLMLVSFYRPTRERNKILIEANAFPSDQYAVKSQIRYHGYDPSSSLIEIAPRAGETATRTEDIEKLIETKGDEIALVMIAGVNYSTGQAFDCSRIAATARARGCVVGFDMAHAAGNVHLKLHDWNPDFAVWCSYKYLNAGPGAIGGCFVHERHARNGKLPRFTGWWGHDKATRFQMGPNFQGIAGAEGWQVSNPSILSMAALRASMEIFDEAGIETLRAKSVTLTSYLEFLLEQQPSDRFSIITPRDPAHRGAMLSLRIKKGGRTICDKLGEQGVICDWREPDILRASLAPLYNSFLDAYAFAEKFISAMEA
jgi:kynureninase